MVLYECENHCSLLITQLKSGITHRASSMIFFFSSVLWLFLLLLHRERGKELWTSSLCAALCPEQRAGAVGSSDLLSSAWALRPSAGTGLAAICLARAVLWPPLAHFKSLLRSSAWQEYYITWGVILAAGMKVLTSHEVSLRALAFPFVLISKGYALE